MAEIISALKFSPEAPVQLPKSRHSVPAAMPSLDHLQITRLTRKMIEAYATIGSCQPLFALLAPDQQPLLDKYTWDRGLIDLIHDYPDVLHNPADLVAMLPEACAAPLFHLVEPVRPCWRDSYHHRRGALSFA